MLTTKKSSNWRIKRYDLGGEHDGNNNDESNKDNKMRFMNVHVIFVFAIILTVSANTARKSIAVSSWKELFIHQEISYLVRVSNVSKMTLNTLAFK
jgi:hypothetical protein